MIGDVVHGTNVCLLHMLILSLSVILSALALSAGCGFAQPNSEPHGGVVMATAASRSAHSLPDGVGPPAVTRRKISSYTLVQQHTKHTEQKYKVYTRTQTHTQVICYTMEPHAHY